MRVPKETKKILFFVEGGIGKNIMATAVVRAIKKQYPSKDIVVIAGCPEVFYNNPNVKRTYNFSNPLYLYEDQVGPDSVVFRIEPYYHFDYINKTKHLVECWCDMLGVKFDGTKPDIFLTPSEIDGAKKRVKEVAGDKKYMLLQWSGGKNPDDKTEMKYKESLAVMFRRALPYEVVAKYATSVAKKYHVGVVGHPNLPGITGTEVVHYPIRNSISLVAQADVIVGIDSWVQHAAAAFDKKAVVFWGGTSPICLGYDTHKNVTKEVCNTPYCHRPNSFLMDLQPNGSIWDCPYGEACLKYSIDEIIDNVKKE